MSIMYGSVNTNELTRPEKLVSGRMYLLVLASSSGRPIGAYLVRYLEEHWDMRQARVIAPVPIDYPTVCKKLGVGEIGRWYRHRYYNVPSGLLKARTKLERKAKNYLNIGQ